MQCSFTGDFYYHSVAEPTVTISREDDGEVKLFSVHKMICNIDLIDEVDVPVTVEFKWYYGTDENRVTVSDFSGSGNAYSSVLTVKNFTERDSGIFLCEGFVTPAMSGSGEEVSGWTRSNIDYVQLRTGKRVKLKFLTHSHPLFLSEISVSIQVDYTPPSDFSLPSPPYYRPASSVSLTCVAHNAVGSVTYQWTSTNTQSFAHESTGPTIQQDILTALVLQQIHWETWALQ